MLEVAGQGKSNSPQQALIDRSAICSAFAGARVGNTSPGIAAHPVEPSAAAARCRAQRYNGATLTIPTPPGPNIQKLLNLWTIIIRLVLSLADMASGLFARTARHRQQRHFWAASVAPKANEDIVIEAYFPRSSVHARGRQNVDFIRL